MWEQSDTNCRGKTLEANTKRMFQVDDVPFELGGLISETVEFSVVLKDVLYQIRKCCCSFTLHSTLVDLTVLMYSMM